MTKPPIFDSTGAPVRTFGRPAMYDRKKAPREDPEFRFQCAVVRYLDLALPADYRFTASSAGVKVGMQTAVKMKAAGNRKGWPDLVLRNRKTGAVRWLELKASGGSLTPEQREFINEVPGHVVVCKTLEEVEAALMGWGIVPRCVVGAASRYGS